MDRQSDLSLVIKYFDPLYSRAIKSQTMQVTIEARDGKVVTLAGNQHAVEFINCSYLGLDMHPKLIVGAKEALERWGVHFCCARSRFSIDSNRQLEEGLSDLFRGRAITFPSVTSAHHSVLPMLAGGVFFGPAPKKVRLIFDQMAHSSMQFLKPLLKRDASIATIAHNDLDELRSQVKAAHDRGEEAVYLGDGVYSMGGLCPIDELLRMANELSFYLYLDDAHGTSIFGRRGEGYCLSRINGAVPDNLFVNFSLAKGFGCNGGGIVVSNRQREHLIRSFGQTYVFSGPLDFSIAGAALASLELHRDGTVEKLQQTLRERVAQATGTVGGETAFSPICMVPIGDAERAIDIGKELLAKGFFVSVTFFPIVPLNRSQLRVCISATHTVEQIHGLTRALDEIMCGSWGFAI